jgi:hypothetical protein
MYKIELAEYHKRKSEKEAKEKHVARVQEPLMTRYRKH